LHSWCSKGYAFQYWVTDGVHRLTEAASRYTLPKSLKSTTWTRAREVQAGLEAQDEADSTWLPRKWDCSPPRATWVADKENVTRKGHSQRRSRSQRTLGRIGYLMGLGLEPPENFLVCMISTCDRLYDAIDYQGRWRLLVGLWTSKIMLQAAGKEGTKPCTML